MPDNLNDSGPEDGFTISLTQEHELDYWTKTLGVTRDELRAAVAGAGSHSVKAVRAYLASTEASTRP